MVRPDDNIVYMRLSKERYKALSRFLPLPPAFYSILRYKIIAAFILCVFLVSIDFINGFFNFVIIFLVISTIIYLTTKYSRKYAEVEYRRMIDNKIIDNEYRMVFYTMHMKKIGAISHLKIRYSDLYKIVETDDSLYLFYDRNNAIIVDRYRCNKDLINFLRTVKPKAYVNMLGSRKYRVGRIQAINEKRGKVLLHLTLILSIVCFFLAPILYFVISNCDIKFLSYRNNYLYYFFFFISFITLILGIKYHNFGFKCKKNIIIGIIGCIIFFMLGFSSRIFNIKAKINYDTLKEYENHFTVPNNGIFYRLEWNDDYYYDSHSSTFMLYDKENFNLFYNSVDEKENWLQFNRLSTTLKFYFPTTMKCESYSDECLYSLYIEEIGIYNELPSNSGKYHVTAFMYDISKNYIQADNYVIDYMN